MADATGNGGLWTSSWKGEKSALGAVLPIFGLTFAAFVLLCLTTFSLPFIDSLYFLWTSQAGGVRFGIWGWCLDADHVCSDVLGLGYTWEPEVSIPITKALAFYPIAAASVFMTLVALLPVLRDRTPRTLRVFAVFAWSSFVFTFLAFVFMIAMWSVADERFKNAGWKVRWGPLPWMSFVATMLLLVVSVNSRRGALAQVCLAQDPPFSAKDWEDKAGRVQLQDFSVDPEKATTDTTFSTASTTPVTKAPMPDFSVMDNATTVVFPRSSDDRKEDEQAKRRYQDNPKLHPSGMGTPLMSGTPYPPTEITEPLRAFRRSSQKSHHSHLSPLRTT
ncbi:hypothetical protein P691DRAFT_707840 [Macrolepiota fuliginosa MF-IS2]|uniref:Uncharacterized protein n=1 Tax=Macrolepiota fuliginosa MF-IS2 TaxID=1400762 RepID=A0A9P5XBK3_9AGAR|nr:hypothetical protein P691DRAFT_707840 [Macrolepiota fuliginosa MF-IS2]